MPEISRFYGIVIKMYFGDHPPPHFHAEYSGHSAIIDLNSLSVLSGSLPPHAMRAKNLEPIGKIDPLP